MQMLLLFLLAMAQAAGLPGIPLPFDQGAEGRWVVGSNLPSSFAEAGVQPHEAVMIGDTSFDMEMAVAAGVRAIGVAWGYHEPRELLDTGAHGVATTMDELEALINE